jgi:hypothetical protein
MFQGMNGKCRQTQWSQVFGADEGSLIGQPVEAVDLIAFQVGGNAAASATDTGRHVVTLRAARGATAVTDLDVCVQPNGQSYTMASGLGESTLTPQAAPVIFTVNRYVKTGSTEVARGVDREVIFPIGGNARMRI